MHKGPSLRSPGWALLAIVILFPTQALLLGGASQRWAQGISLILIGLCLALSPPVVSLGRRTGYIFAGFIASALIALIPLPFSVGSELRLKLGIYFEGLLPRSISLQPWLTGEAALLLLAAVLWFYWIATLPFSDTQRRLVYRIYAAVIILFATVCIILYWKQTPPAFWLSKRQFGPFPSRNLTGNVIALGGLMAFACAIDLLRRRKWWGVVFLLGLIPIVLALILNISRAGIGIFAVGVFAWMLALGVKWRSTKFSGLAVSCTIICAILFWFSGAEIVSRFSERDLASSSFLGFRKLIYEDTFHLIRANPWLGIGLGNFESVFPLFRGSSYNSYRLIHPESDWLWLLAEIGIVGMTCLIAALVAVARRLVPQGGRGWSLDTAALLAIGLFMLHGLIDVAGHRLGSASPVLLLAGLLLGRSASEFAPLNIPWRITFRITGCMLAFAGMGWILAAHGAIHLPGKTTLEQTKELARAKTATHEWSGAMEASSKGLMVAPLEWSLYSSRAMAHAGHRDWIAALADFERARRLQPHRSDLAMMEGEVWSTTVPGLALSPWRHALAVSPGNAPQLFGVMLNQSKHAPSVQSELHKWAAEDPRLKLTLLLHLSGAPFHEELASLLRVDPNLSTFTPDQLRRLLQAWAKQDTHNTLINAIKERPHWQKIAWPYLARSLANEGKWEEAYRLARSHVDQPTIPQIALSTSKQETQRRWLLDKSDFAAALELIKLHQQAGESGEAFTTVKGVNRDPNAPIYFLFLQAEFAAKSGNWEEAWSALSRYARDRF